MTEPAQTFVFKRHNRSQRAVIVLICVYAALGGLLVIFDAVWWLVALLALTTLPALWDVVQNTNAGVQLDDQEISWHTGQRKGDIPLVQIEKFRFDTRWDFSVRVSAILKSGKRVRLPDESLPPHQQFEGVLKDAGFAVERHHFRVF
ncbi:hypothetical protein RA28_04855 [Ruegeria sp. ANG-S4]|nr:hypothetical protein RA28_04855 [Ruegeria sp. ANG-S4]